MEKANNYDEALQRAEAIIVQLEQSEAISMDDYRRLASEATALLRQCRSELEAVAGEAETADVP